MIAVEPCQKILHVPMYLVAINIGKTLISAECYHLN